LAGVDSSFATIYFDTNTTAQPGYYNCASAMPNSNASSISFFPGQFGGAPWTSIAPDGSLIFARDMSTWEIYSLDVDFP
jgi:hypothetical protein